MFNWPVVPLCESQLKDVAPNDIIEGGLYRYCDIYKGGGGYDQFNKIYEKRTGYLPKARQFVVQLRGCPLRCDYCYVTEKGVWGKPTFRTYIELIKAYIESGVDTFHLMGGAPALYLDHWKELHDSVSIFHSDFLLVESNYNKSALQDLRGLHAVSLKDINYPNISLLYRNLDKLVDQGVNFYVTFTGEPILRANIIKRYGEAILKDSFVISIKRYKALDNIQNTPIREFSLI